MDLDSSLKQTKALSDVLPDLKRFASAVWGNPGAVLRHHEPEDFEYINLAGYFNAFQFMFMGGLTHDKVLVRHAYRVALEAMQTYTYTSYGAHIIGQPGIGKTLFLIYALVYFLGRKEAIVLQVRPDFCVLFNDTAVSYPIEYNQSLDSTLNGRSVAWALCHSSQYVEHPPSQLRFCKFKIIQTTSPKRLRWKISCQEHRAGIYMMDIWPDKEIANLATLLGLDSKRMCTLASKWGNIPGNLMHLLDEDDWTIDAMYRDGAVLAIDDCQDILYREKNLDIPDGVGPLFFCMGPKSEDEFSHVSLRLQVLTPTLRRFLGEAIQRKDPLQRTEFFKAFDRMADTGGQGITNEILFHMLRGGVEQQDESDPEDASDEELQEMEIDED